ncbi:PepSY domain-containing protein [Brevibacterium sp. UCMA 11754]|uniref:PepSY domain-containing protein n=1 Tax=Brevibacterium sp. UCMA 11754 TaxID=2749198 RepID=UPI001F451EAB|nr:PepSY domain-containing protein [Brevibacterium sp. UCMA 11754]MCF2574141.1 PepSY domain-containing protein [Brevibacterium sp. UCMA 11754]
MKTQRWATRAAAGTMIAAFALTGCSSGDSGDGQASESEGQTPESAEAQNASDNDESGAAEDTKSQGSTTTSSSGLAADADLSKESPSVAPKDAIATAKKEAKDGTVHGIELDFDERDKAWQYEVKVIDGATDFDVEIDAETGEVVDTEKDSSDDKEKAIDLNDPMTFDEALKLAQDKASGRLDGWKLESDDGRIEYQFYFDDKGEEIEVSVDVESKKVTVDD